MARVEYLSLPDNRRAIAVSDIHGHLSLLKALLAKVRLAENDVLLILGDMVEKGPESLATLRFLMALRGRFSVHPLLGNCDGWLLPADWSKPETLERVRRYMLRQKPERQPGLLAHMCLEAGIDPLAENFSPARAQQRVREMFGPEISFLARLPHIIETERYTFAHAGLPGDGKREDADPELCMRDNLFLSRDSVFPNWVVVGHTPVSSCREDICRAAPLIDSGRRVIGIDGGCGHQEDGQLNALILENDTFTAAWVDGFPLRRVLNRQESSPKSFFIRWGDNEVSLLSPAGAEFCRVRHLRTGYEMSIPSNFLYEHHGVLRTRAVTDYRPPLAPGDIVSVISETSRGYRIKKDSVSGWYSGELSPL